MAQAPAPRGRPPGQPTTLSGPELIARVLVLEGFVVALGAVALPSAEGGKRDEWLAEVRKDALARANETKHPAVADHAEDYADSMVKAIVDAAK